MSKAEAAAGVGAAARQRTHRPVPGRFLRSELLLIFGRRRNLAGLAVLAAVPVIVAIAIKVVGPSSQGGPTFFAAVMGNGLFVALASLALELTLFLPLAVSAIAGDTIAGEANQGTLRYLLTVPVGRTRLLLVKLAAVVVFAFAATLLVAVAGAIAGCALFGGGPMTLLSGVQVSFVAGALRVLAAVAYLALSLSALGAVGLFVSTLTEQPIGATVAVLVFDLMCQVLDQIPQLDWLHPWLLTHWWLSFGDLLRDPIAWHGIGRGLALAAGYTAVAWLAAWARFAGKDVTS